MHLREYIAGFDKDVREIFDAFGFENQIEKLDKAGRLYRILGRFLDNELDFHPDMVPNDRMGDIFEELIRKFSEISNETAGEHFTPREVVRLCGEFALIGKQQLLDTPHIVQSVYDPACGTGGMLSVCEELVRERHPQARTVLFGQELNPESWAVCRAEMLVKGQDPDRIFPGSTLSEDGVPGKRFDLMMANPPFGVDWADDHDFVVDEHDKDGFDGRFGAGLPRKSDGALLFLQNMLAKMKPADEDGGSRIAIIFNASPLFSGDAGSGESEIRRWILDPDNDWLEAIVALPEQLFYNTGIHTYLWVLSSKKDKQRVGKVQLIDARNLWEEMKPRSYGNKRRRLDPDNHIKAILNLYRSFEKDGELSKVFDLQDFGYRRIAVERPLRLRYRAGEDAVAALEQLSSYARMNPDAQERLAGALRALNGLNTTDRDEVAGKVRVLKLGTLTQTQRNALWAALGVRDPSAPVVTRRDGSPEPDPELREYELIPLNEDPDAYIEREVKPFVEDAWVEDYDGKLGYEIPLTRLFYRYEPPRPLADVDTDLKQVEEDIQKLLGEVTQ